MDLENFYFYTVSKKIPLINKGIIKQQNIFVNSAYFII